MAAQPNTNDGERSNSTERTALLDNFGAVVDDAFAGKFGNINARSLEAFAAEIEREESRTGVQLACDTERTPYGTRRIVIQEGSTLSTATLRFLESYDLVPRRGAFSRSITPAARMIVLGRQQREFIGGTREISANWAVMLALFTPEDQEKPVRFMRLTGNGQLLEGINIVTGEEELQDILRVLTGNPKLSLPARGAVSKGFLFNALGIYLSGIPRHVRSIRQIEEDEVDDTIPRF